MSQWDGTTNTMEALVLAGGKGTRLRKAVGGLPKSLAPIGQHPFLNYLLGWLRAQGVTEVILAVGHHRKAIIQHYARHKPQDMHVTYSIETMPLGTGGALRNSRALLKSEEFLVLNGDSIFDVDLRQMLSFHRRHRSVVTLALGAPAHTGRYGSVLLDVRSRVKAFVEKQTVTSAEGRDSPEVPRWISGGVYVMSKTVFRHIPRRQDLSLEKEVFPRLIGGPFYGFPWKGYFIDIGVPEDYQRAKLELPERFRPC